ncbi:MAG: hypothetical protein ABIZ36_06760 [Gemmatimonadaceae bacterium]
MPSGKLSSAVSIALLATATVFIASCDGAKTTDPMAGHNHAIVAPSFVKYDSPLANQVKGGLAKFHSQVQASKAGYALASPCIANPAAGGMGFHWVNGSLVDPVFDPMNPEAVLYDTSGKLVAVEYIVIDIGQPAPTFGGEPFNIGGTPVPVPHWSLHVWLYEPNSNGLFNPWNPAVVCP